MRRSPALVSLSRDHHLALVVARRLRRATPATAVHAQIALGAWWPVHGRVHFRLEEEVLFPAYAACGDPHHPLLARALCDHVAIRGRADQVLNGSLDQLDALGELIAAHVRLEERELFPLIENAMPADRLAVVAAALEQAEDALIDG